MGKLLYKRYRVQISHLEALKRNEFALFSADKKTTQFEIEIAVKPKSTVPDICKYAEERFKNLDNMQILSVEFLGVVDFVELDV